MLGTGGGGSLTFTVDGTTQELPACAVLCHLPPEILHHPRIPCRHPLGVYNVSLEKLFGRITRLSELTKRYVLTATPISTPNRDLAELFDRLADAIELVIHAAGEHVDDIDTICRTLFNSDREYAKSALVRKLKSSIKPIRDPFSGLSNHIKHSHNRIRIFETELRAPDEILLFLAFLIESCDVKK